MIYISTLDLANFIKFDLHSISWYKPIFEQVIREIILYN